MTKRTKDGLCFNILRSVRGGWALTVFAGNEAIDLARSPDTERLEKLKAQIEEALLPFKFPFSAAMGTPYVDAELRQGGESYKCGWARSVFDPSAVTPPQQDAAGRALLETSSLMLRVKKLEDDLGALTESVRLRAMYLRRAEDSIKSLHYQAEQQRAEITELRQWKQEFKKALTTII